MNNECEKCGEVISCESCDCGESNQQVIENYLEDGHDVEFLDKFERRCVVFKKFKNLFYGVELGDERTITGFEGEKLKEATKIKIYKEETKEEKIKRLLEDGKVKLLASGQNVVISDFYDNSFFGRYDLHGVWHSVTYKGNHDFFTNITPYTNE